ncbi:MAG: hypothetical protein ABJN84_06385 [Flavobacteriaceae bacterium]
MIIDLIITIIHQLPGRFTIENPELKPNCSKKLTIICRMLMLPKDGKNTVHKTLSINLGHLPNRAFSTIIKILQTAFFICLFMISASLFSQGLSGSWTGIGTTWTSNVCYNTEITATVTNLENGATVTFSSGDFECNMPNTFSSDAVVGNASLEPVFMLASNDGR